MSNAIILLSGGLDSSTCLACAKRDGYECHALSFDYQQRNHAELHAATTIAKNLGAVSHRIIKLPFIHDYGHSALTDHKIEVPEYEASNDVPITYVPARNTIFLAITLAWAEVLQAYDIFIGANKADYQNYPDCRPAFLQAFTDMANLSTRAGVSGQNFTIHAPLLSLDKKEIICLGHALHVDYSLTVSCYRANDRGEACGRCLSCTLRKQGFQKAKLTDPTIYQKNE